MYSNVRKPSKNTCDFCGDSKLVSQKMQYVQCRMNWIFRTHNIKFQRPPSNTANDFHSFWYEEKHPWHSLEDPENWPFSSSLALSHMLSLSKLQLMEIWVLIHTCTHTPQPQGFCTSTLFLLEDLLPLRLFILQISTPLPLPCSHKGRRSPWVQSVPGGTYHRGNLKFYVSLCNHLINSSLLYWNVNSMKTGSISICTHH